MCYDVSCPHMMEKQRRDSIGINYGAPMKPLIDSVMETIVQQPDFLGIGGHGLQDHGGHGLHRQTSIGLNGITINGVTINFRNLKP